MSGALEEYSRLGQMENLNQTEENDPRDAITVTMSSSNVQCTNEDNSDENEQVCTGARKQISESHHPNLCNEVTSYCLGKRDISFIRMTQRQALRIYVF